MIKGFVPTDVNFPVNHCRGNLQHVQVSQLTIQHPVVAEMGCQLSFYVMYGMCNILGQLASVSQNRSKFEFAVQVVNS